MIQQSHFWSRISDENDNRTLKETDTSMFIAALFTVVKIRKAFKCPLINRWIKNMQDLLYSHKKKRKSCHLQQHRLIFRLSG